MPAAWLPEPRLYDVQEAKTDGNPVRHDDNIISLYNNILIYYTNYHTSMIEAVKLGHLGLRDAHMSCGMVPCQFHAAGNGQNRFTGHANFDRVRS